MAPRSFVASTDWPDLSEILNLHPEEEPWCAGYAPSKGRRCHARTNARGRSSAMRLLRVGTQDLRDGECIDHILEDIAPHVLCTSFHQNQAPGLVSSWKKRVQRFLQSQPAPEPAPIVRHAGQRAANVSAQHQTRSIPRRRDSNIPPPQRQTLQQSHRETQRLVPQAWVQARNTPQAHVAQPPPNQQPPQLRPQQSREERFPRIFQPQPLRTVPQTRVQPVTIRQEPVNHTFPNEHERQPQRQPQRSTPPTRQQSTYVPTEPVAPVTLRAQRAFLHQTLRIALEELRQIENNYDFSASTRPRPRDEEGEAVSPRTRIPRPVARRSGSPGQFGVHTTQLSDFVRGNVVPFRSSERLVLPDGIPVRQPTSVPRTTGATSGSGNMRRRAGAPSSRATSGSTGATSASGPRSTGTTSVSRSRGVTTGSSSTVATSGSSSPSTAAVSPPEAIRRSVEGECAICRYAFDVSPGFAHDIDDEEGVNEYELVDGPGEDEEEEEQTVEVELAWCKAECGVNYHRECIDRWLETPRWGPGTCPSCRREWRD